MGGGEECGRGFLADSGGVGGRSCNESSFCLGRMGCRLCAVSEWVMQLLLPLLLSNQGCFLRKGKEAVCYCQVALGQHWRWDINHRARSEGEMLKP